jgi:hypothetical protein
MFLKGGQMESVLNKAVLSSALNAFVITLIGKFVESGADVSALTGDVVTNVLNAAITAAAWVIIRAVNPKDHKFGIGAVTPKVASKKK